MYVLFLFVPGRQDLQKCMRTQCFMVTIYCTVNYRVINNINDLDFQIRWFDPIYQGPERAALLFHKDFDTILLKREQKIKRYGVFLM